MRIKSNIPEIATLKLEVTKKCGFDLKTHADFLNLVTSVESVTHVHLSETTLERLWNYSTRGYANVREKTLDILSKYVGDDSWEEFKNRKKREAQIESEIYSGNIVNADALKVGDRIKISWMPDRVCIVKYLGDNRFIAVHTENATIQPGDSFSCLQFQKGQPLCMDKFQHAIDEENRYIVGKVHGLTSIEILPDE